MADIAGAAAGVAVQGAADCARNADQRLQPGQAFANRGRDDVAQLGPAAGLQPGTLDLDVGKRRVGQADHHAAYAFIAHQHVRPATQHPHGQALFAATPQHIAQLLAGARFGEVLGRSAKLKPSVRSHRLSRPHDIFQAFQPTHQILSVCHPRQPSTPRHPDWQRRQCALRCPLNDEFSTRGLCRPLAR